jgi:CheY-like chemotaxis protein
MDGQEAVARATADRPALILMDVQMPVLDGLEATRRLRADPATAAIPIITLTALAMPEDRLRCLEAGANAYLSKPLQLAELDRLILEHLPPA